MNGPPVKPPAPGEAPPAPGRDGQGPGAAGPGTGGAQPAPPEAGREGRVRPWRWVSDEATCRTPVFTVLRRTTVSPKDGREKAFCVLEAPSWANIIAIDGDRRVVMVNQYRHGSRGFSLELPGGVVGPGEDPVEAAARELTEETGYTAGPAERLIDLNPNPALFGNCITTAVARGAERTRGTSFDENEEAETVLLPLDELERAFRDGRVTHALMLAAIGYFLAVKDRYL